MTIQNKKIIEICDNRRLFYKYLRNSISSVIFIAGLGDSYETWKKSKTEYRKKHQPFPITGRVLAGVKSHPTRRLAMI